jgi:hypothetical protein
MTFNSDKSKPCLNHYSKIKIRFFYISVLDSAVLFTDNILPVRIPSVSIEDPDVYAGDSASISGWGNGTKTSLDTADIQIYKEK